MSLLSLTALKIYTTIIITLHSRATLTLVLRGRAAFTLQLGSATFYLHGGDTHQFRLNLPLHGTCQLIRKRLQLALHTTFGTHQGLYPTHLLVGGPFCNGRFPKIANIYIWTD